MLLVLTARLGFCQDYIYMNNSKYPSTPTWKFYIKDYVGPLSELEVCIGKDSIGKGLILLASGVEKSDSKIHDSIQLVLSDSSHIFCADIGLKFYDNGKTFAMFDLSSADIEKLKKVNIERISFFLNGGVLEKYVAYNVSEYAYSKGLRFTANQTAGYVEKLFK